VRFTEINLFGVYVAPTTSMMVVAWVATIGLRWFAARFGLTQYVLLAQGHRRRVAAQTASTPRGYDQPCNFCSLRAFSRSTLAIANRRAILRRLPFVSRRFQCRMTASGAQLPILHGRRNGRVCPYSGHSLARPDRLDMAPRVGALSFPLTWLEGQRQFGDAAGDVETPVTFDAERLQRD
jgi:hypothetical protein